MKIPTLINSSSKINGELIFTTEVRIDGEVFGKVESDKSVIIGAEGFVKGFLRARDLVVFGRLEGNIIVSGTTVLHENASVFGNLYTKVFEVKEGAIITARVITYDKLEAIDEAQIYLAEEMIKIEPARRQIHNYEKAQVTPERPSEKADKIEVPVYKSKDKLLKEAVAADSGDILSRIMEHNSLLGDATIPLRKEEIHVVKEAVSTPETVVPLPETADIRSEAIEVLSEATTELPQTAELLTVPETAEVAGESLELLPETIEFELIDQILAEDDDDMFTLLSTPDNSSENQNHRIPDLFTTEAGPNTGSGRNLLLEFDFEDNDQDTNQVKDELSSGSVSKPFSIAECLGEPVKEESQRAKKGKKKTYSSDATLVSQTVRKNKVYSLSGFEELRNLLIPVKYHDLKSAENAKFSEKKSEQEKHNSKKVNDNDSGNKPKVSEKNDLFLNDAIRQLPIDDYSSLFN